LPDFSVGKTIVVPHFLKFKYKIEETGNDCEENGDQDQQEGESKSNDEEYLIEKRIDFPLKKVCYTNIYL
jgi:hypothetical protein